VTCDAALPQLVRSIRESVTRVRVRASLIAPGPSEQSAQAAPPESRANVTTQGASVQVFAGNYTLSRSTADVVSLSRILVPCGAATTLLVVASTSCACRGFYSPNISFCSIDIPARSQTSQIYTLSFPASHTSPVEQRTNERATPRHRPSRRARCCGVHLQRHHAANAP
jgi:hypothetical protein